MLRQQPHVSVQGWRDEELSRLLVRRLDPPPPLAVPQADVEEVARPLTLVARPRGVATGEPQREGASEAVAGVWVPNHDTAT